MKANYVISLCGTSILLNGASEDIRKLCIKYSNASCKSEIPNELSIRIDEHLAQRCENVLKANILDAKKRSAELNALLHFYDDMWTNASQDQHVLLHTDTWLGEQAAKIVQKYLLKNKVNVELQTFKGLRTDSMNNFRHALAYLARWCANDLPTSGYSIIFNLTGGFKSIQGFMQTLGMFYADESIYIFERSKELLRIPRLPVRMNAQEEVQQHLQQIRCLTLDLDQGQALQEDQLPELYVLEMDDDKYLSDWGQVIWNESKKEIYTQKLLEPLTDTYRFSRKFRETVKCLSPDRIHIVNERMDQLAVYLHDRKDNPKSLSFKSLKGNPHPPCTHELYAWSDQGAKRIFGYYDEQKIFIIEQMDKHL